MYECNAWDFPETLSTMRFRRNWLERQEFVNKALSRHRLVLGRGLRGLENTRTPEELYRVFGEVKGAALWGEKSPVYGARLRQLARQYPGCSFILLWRDPIEIYRSVTRAGRDSRFFRKRGMLSRLIFNHEQMIRQAAGLERAGVRVYHVTYDDLVDKTEKVCRGLCRFLGIEFYEKMLDLTHADFSAITQAPHHDHLRRGIIERQQYSEEIADERLVKKLQRFRIRWNRLLSQWLHIQDNPLTGPEPGMVERLYHNLAGSSLQMGHNAKRALFEFLPLPWLRTYRQMKRWFLARDAKLPLDQLSPWQEFSAHWVTILVSGIVLAGVATIDFITGPDVTFALFYLIPVALLTLIINRRWGTFAAALSAVVWSVLQHLGEHGTLEFGVLLWNSAMRFLLFQLIILLLNRVRIEMVSVGGSNA